MVYRERGRGIKAREGCRDPERGREEVRREQGQREGLKRVRWREDGEREGMIKRILIL